MVLDQLACNLKRNDELPNIELVELLVAQNDTAGIGEVVQGLKMEKRIANDCIKVLYEVGERKPQLIASYVTVFLDALMSRNNRIVWGAMTALVTIADDQASTIFMQIDKVKYAYETGSVITVDNSISVFAKLCNADSQYEKELFPFLMVHLEKCRPKEVAQHAERMAICIHSENKRIFEQVLVKRKSSLSNVQIKRIDKLIKKLNEMD